MFIHRKHIRALSCWEKHTHSLSRLSESVLLIEWLLMTLRVNLCLAGSSGCLRGRLIKGNETSWGLSLSRSPSRQTVTDLCSHAFLRVSSTVDTNSPWRDAVAQKGLCAATHVSSGRGMPAFQTDYNFESLSPNGTWPTRTADVFDLFGLILRLNALKGRPVPSNHRAQGGVWEQKKKKKVRMGTRWNKLIMSYSGRFFRACQGVDCTFRWKGLIGNDNLLREGICPPTRPGCLSASSATISTGRLADRSCCQRPQARACSRINTALVSLSPASKTRQRIKKKNPLRTTIKEGVPRSHKQPLHYHWNKSGRKSWEGEHRGRKDALKCFAAIGAVQPDPGHQSHLNIFHSWGCKPTGWCDTRTIVPQFPPGPCRSVDMSRN